MKLEVCPEVMEARGEVEGVPGSLTGGLLPREDGMDTRIYQAGLVRQEGVGKHGDSVDRGALVVAYGMVWISWLFWLDGYSVLGYSIFHCC